MRKFINMLLNRRSLSHLQLSVGTERAFNLKSISGLLSACEHGYSRFLPTRFI